MKIVLQGMHFYIIYGIIKKFYNIIGNKHRRKIAIKI